MVCLLHMNQYYLVCSCLFTCPLSKSLGFFWSAPSSPQIASHQKQSSTPHTWARLSTPSLRNLGKNPSSCKELKALSRSINYRTKKPMESFPAWRIFFRPLFFFGGWRCLGIFLGVRGSGDERTKKGMGGATTWLFLSQSRKIEKNVQILKDVEQWFSKSYG